jgi:hypothetical protein
MVGPTPLSVHSRLTILRSFRLVSSVCWIEQHSALIRRYSADPLRLNMSHDETLDRLHELTNCLTARLVDAETVRTRLTKARQQAKWPDVERASRRFADVPNLPYFDPSDVDKPKQ